MWMPSTRSPVFVWCTTSNGPSPVATIGGDWKGKLSPLLYAVAIAAAFVAPWLSMAIYTLVALIWIVPDRRIERILAAAER